MTGWRLSTSVPRMTRQKNKTRPAPAAAVEQQAPAPPRRASKVSIVYGVLDLLLAALYLFIFFRLVPSRSGTFGAIVVAVSLFLGLGGIGMISGRPWGRRAAFTACLIMLLACAALIVLLLLSAAYLHGIYDGIGEAGVAAALISALLSIEVVGLIPGLQLAHLLRTRRAQP
jgi:hypothetical protein